MLARLASLLRARGHAILVKLLLPPRRFIKRDARARARFIYTRARTHARPCGPLMRSRGLGRPHSGAISKQRGPLYRGLFAGALCAIRRTARKIAGRARAALSSAWQSSSCCAGRPLLARAPICAGKRARRVNNELPGGSPGDVSFLRGAELSGVARLIFEPWDGRVLSRGYATSVFFFLFSRWWLLLEV